MQFAGVGGRVVEVRGQKLLVLEVGGLALLLFSFFLIFAIFCAFFVFFVAFFGWMFEGGGGKGGKSFCRG